ncbi:MAG TPA: ABC transporter permease [Nitrososphaerales archaeon]|nr:ABC transporter permease [Nitrososphaerales archaeon]
MMELPIDLKKIAALTQRDIRNWSTYKTAALTSVLGTLLGVASWGLSTTYRNRAVPDYNTDYVSFLITGVIIANLILPLGQGVQKGLNPQTIENILMTGMPTPTFVLGQVMWPYILSVIFLIPQVFIGVYVFHAHLIINYVSLILAVAISSAIVFSFSVISTGMRIVTKVNDPFTWAISVMSQIFSGMTFPVSHLNDYIPGLSTVSWFLPQTWIYHIVRLATLEDGSLTQPDVATSFLVTLVIAIVLVPISMRVFQWGLARAKRDGSLGHY